MIYKLDLVLRIVGLFVTIACITQGSLIDLDYGEFNLWNSSTQFLVFKKFIKTYKIIVHPNEVNGRAEIFKKNLKLAGQDTEKAKKSGYNTKYGINKFSHLTPEEFSKSFLGAKLPTALSKGTNNLFFSPNIR